MKNYTIAITGKGGTGKTTLAAALVTGLIRQGHTPVLAVDADPNACLDQVLGVQTRQTVGRIREECREYSAANTSGIAKRHLVELKINAGLVEADGFDLIAMGRPEGPGCYCYANNLFRDVIGELARNYPFCVIDNEAGLENLSRRLYQRIDLLIIVGDPSQRGLQTIRRLHALAKEMDIAYERLAVAVNLLRPDSQGVDISAVVDAVQADEILRLPYDNALAAAGEDGRRIQDLPMNNPVLSEVAGFLQRVKL